jgi:hypothetical protein
MTARASVKKKSHTEDDLILVLKKNRHLQSRLVLSVRRKEGRKERGVQGRKEGY